MIMAYSDSLSAIAYNYEPKVVYEYGEFKFIFNYNKTLRNLSEE